jgi:UDP-N-acetylglucosamine 3-dehydrogenase
MRIIVRAIPQTGNGLYAQPVGRTHRTVCVAVVGAGNMGRHHVRNYAELPGARLCAVVDADADRTRDLAERYGVAAYASVEQLLAAEPDVEAVSVATPTSSHFAIAGQLLRAGKHVLVEKPIAASAAEGRKLTALADERGRVLAVGHVERFNPAVTELKRLIDSGRMGTTLSVVARRVGVMPPQIRDADVIVDLAVHDIDIFRFLLGADRPDDVYANAGRAIAEDRFDYADIFLRFGDVACLLQVNWVTPVKIRSLAVTGTGGYAEVEYVTQSLVFHEADAVDSVETFAELEAYSMREPTRPDIEHGEPLGIELLEFLKAVRGETSAIVTAADGTMSIRIASDVARRAGRRGGQPATARPAPGRTAAQL